MVEHTCPKCNKVFTKKSHYTRHMLRQNDCSIKKTVQKHDGTTTYICHVCKKEYKYKSGLSRHTKLAHGHDKVKEKIELQKEINDLKEKYEKLLEKQKKLDDGNAVIGNNNTNNNSNNNNVTNSNNTVTNNNVTNNNNVINNNYNVIVPHGHEDLSKLTDRDILNALAKGYRSVFEIIRTIHFNDKFPENQNIYIPNRRQKFVLVSNGEFWELKNLDDHLHDLYEWKIEFLGEKFKHLYKRLKPYFRKKFQEFLDNKNDEKVIEFNYNDITMLLYNKKSMVKQTDAKRKKITN